ncbi:MAG: 3-dehydroquinate dehydratase, partial [Candidatus Omnitrophica bacterium]|nr:3-dehydroquinate dehydratase [Candidatus Omnitrophota bacterium]
MPNILIIHGPNLRLLGKREPDTYGTTTLQEINARLQALADELRVSLRIEQRNGEGDIVTLLAEAADWADALVINPAAYTHTSIAIRDAITGIGIPAVEVHLSNIHKRESFRHHSFISGV